MDTPAPPLAGRITVSFTKNGNFVLDAHERCLSPFVWEFRLDVGWV